MPPGPNFTICHAGADIHLPNAENHTVLAVNNNNTPSGTIRVTATGTVTLLVGTGITGCNITINGSANINTYNKELDITIQGDAPKLTLYHSVKRVVTLRIKNEARGTELLLCGRYASVCIVGSFPLAKISIDEEVSVLSSGVPTVVLPADGRSSAVRVSAVSGDVALGPGVRNS